VSRGARQQDDELFATPAEHHIVLPTTGFQRSGEGDKHLIAFQMAKQVVDVFEMIGIHQQQAKLLLRRKFIQIV
jgi:hypothetical protein